MKPGYIIITTEGQKSFRYEIADSRISIGRDGSNDIIIPDSKVSRKHCWLELRNGIATLYDNESKNGVFINGVRLKQCKIADGDHITIGNSKLAVKITREIASKAPGEEITIEFDTIACCVFPNEHTQQHIIFTGAAERNETLVPALITRDESQQQKFFSFLGWRKFLQERKIFLLSLILFCIGGGLFLIVGDRRQLTLPASQSSTPAKIIETTTTAEKEPADAKTDTTDKTSVVPDREVTDKKRAEATRIAHEADTLNTLGRHRQAFTLYQQALQLDPDNDFAKTHLELLKKQIEQLAWNYFNNGMQAYRLFEYETAINQWEKVLYLLENNKNHTLYSKTVTFLDQAKSALHK